MSVRTAVLLLVLLHGVLGQGSRQCGVCTCQKNAGCISVDCSYRNASKVPPQVPNSTCILSMMGNHIQELGDNIFQRLVNLTELNLSENNISRMSNLTFAGLTHLRKLNLNDNNIDFEGDGIGLNVFKPLVTLKELNLKVNSYSDYPSRHIRALISLVSISLDGLKDKALGYDFSFLSILTTLDLAGVVGKSSCNLSSMQRETFQYVTMVRKLNMSNCGLCFSNGMCTWNSYRDVLAPFDHLEVLDLSLNENLSFQGVADITVGLNPSHLRELYINKIVHRFTGCVIVAQNVLANLLNAPLAIIEANDNHINFIEVKAMKNLPRTLKHLSITNTRLSPGLYLWHLESLSSLTSLRLSGSHQPIDLFPRKDTTLFPSTINNIQNTEVSCNSFELYSEEIIHISQKWLTIGTADRPFPIPQRLHKFEFAVAEMFYVIKNVHLASNSLRHINLSCNVLTHWIGPVEGLENVTYLDLSYNFAMSVKPSFFENFDSLRHLNVSWNRLGCCLGMDTNGTIFSKLNKLLSLDLMGNSIIHLPKHLFKGLHSLQVLKLSHNNIRRLYLQYNTNMDLRFIDMSFNDIDFLSKEERHSLDVKAAKNNLTLDFTSNRFECICDTDNLDFLDWLQTTAAVLMNRDQLNCIDDSRNKMRLTPKYNQLQHVCRPFTVIFMVVVSVIIFVLCCLAFGMTYRFRWWIIYWYFVGKRKFHRLNYEPVYDFDAFVSYADVDVEFVRPLMLSRLENEQGLNLYIRHRDSTPGDGIADAIIDAIQRSRKCVLLMSQASLARKWCRYELQMANVEQISSKRNLLVIVLLEVVPNALIPSELLYHMKVKSPLEYPAEDHSQTDVFWSCLTESIRSDN